VHLFGETEKKLRGTPVRAGCSSFSIMIAYKLDNQGLILSRYTIFLFTIPFRPVLRLIHPPVEAEEQKQRGIWVAEEECGGKGLFSFNLYGFSPCDFSLEHICCIN
jgi:hypothetical protein